MSGDGASSQVSDGGISIALAVQSAVEVGTEREERVFVVGGVVRDLLCGLEVGDQDLDLVVEGDGITFAKALAARVGGVVATHPAFLTAKLQSPFSAVQAGSTAPVPSLSEVDIVTARSERYEVPGALPVVAAASIEVDLLRRDFSVNAMALPLSVYKELLAGKTELDELRNSIVDPCEGKRDLNHKTLRILHKQSFSDDPTRLFRCLRYIQRMGFSMDEDTRTAFDASVGESAVRTLSTRRVWNELMVGAQEAKGSACVEAFKQEGLLTGHKLLPDSQEEVTLRGLARLTEVRRSVTGRIVRDATTLLFVTALLRVSAIEVLREAQIPKSVQRRARAVLELVDGNSISDPRADTPTADLVSADILCAAFALSGSAHLLTRLQALAEWKENR